jgi:hypothetical protein
MSLGAYMSKPLADASRRIEMFTRTARRRAWTVKEKAAFKQVRARRLTAYSGAMG